MAVLISGLFLPSSRSDFQRCSLGAIESYEKGLNTFQFWGMPIHWTIAFNLQIRNELEENWLKYTPLSRNAMTGKLEKKRRFFEPKTSILGPFQLKANIHLLNVDWLNKTGLKKCSRKSIRFFGEAVSGKNKQSWNILIGLIFRHLELQKNPRVKQIIMVWKKIRAALQQKIVKGKASEFDSEPLFI